MADSTRQSIESLHAVKKSVRHWGYKARPELADMVAFADWQQDILSEVSLLSSEALKVSAALSSLDVSARVIVSRQVSADLESLFQVVKTMVFGVFSLSDLDRQWRDLSWTPSGSLTSFLSSFINLRSLLDPLPSARESLLCLMHAFPHPLSRAVERDANFVSTFKALIDNKRSWNESWPSLQRVIHFKYTELYGSVSVPEAHAASVTSPAQALPTPPITTSPVEPDSSASAAPVSHVRGKPNGPRSRHSSLPSKQQRRPQTHPHGRSSGEKVTCFTCGGKGHYASVCPSPKPPSSQ